MSRNLSWMLALIFLSANAILGQQTDLEQELRKELDELKGRLAYIEALLEKLHNKRISVEETNVNASPIPKQTKSVGQQSKRAPALNTPPMLSLNPATFKKQPPRFDILLQSRGDYFVDTGKNSTFFLRKAELGVKGNIVTNVDFSIEFDPVRPNDPLRRTYIRLTHLPWLHIKFGLEKAPIGLEELTSTAQIPFVDRSEINDRFAAAEDLGVHLESHWPNWMFQIAVTNGGRRLLRDDNRHKDVTARVVWAPHSRISFGAATLQGRVGSDRQERDRYNLEFKLGSNLSGFQSEFYRGKDANVWSSAYYVSGYLALPLNSTLLTHLQPVIRYEQIDRNDRNQFEELRLLTLGFNLMFDSHRSKFQINFLKELHTGTRKDELRAQYQVEF